MTEEVEDFIDALLRYVEAALTAAGETPDYCQEALQVVDARNHLFRSVGVCATDEEQGIYALRDLCAMDEDLMELRPDRGRAAAVARNMGLMPLR